MTNTIDTIFNDFRQSIQIDNIALTEREQKLKAELIERFGIKMATSLSGSILSQSINYAVNFYLIGRLAMVYIELHAVLERTAILVLPRLLSGPIHIEMYTKERDAIDKLLERKQLSDLIPLLKVLEIWDKSDERKAKNLIAKRNGIAHKNPEIISKRFNDGKYLNTAQINEIVEKDKKSHVVIVDTIGLILKIISK